MSGMVQVAVAGDVTEAEDLQEALREAGVEAEIRAEDEADAYALFVREEDFEVAQDAVEAFAADESEDL
jgi:hypothetical protein